MEWNSGGVLQYNDLLTLETRQDPQAFLWRQIETSATQPRHHRSVLVLARSESVEVE